MDFLNSLKDLLQFASLAEFSRACEKRQSNMSNYLTGVTKPGDSVLEDCILNATVSRVFDEPLDGDTRLGNKARRLRSRVLDSAISNLFGQDIKPLEEIAPIPDKQNELPKSGGVYVLYDSAGNVLYIGQAKSFRAEVWQTLKQRKIPVGMRFGPSMKKVNPTIWKLAWYMSLYEIDNSRLRHNVEALLIRVFINQTHNSNIGQFKISYTSG